MNVRRCSPVLALGALLVPVSATAQTPDPYKLPEPVVTAAQVFKAPSSSKCIKAGKTIKLSVLAPTGLTYGSLTIKAGSASSLSLGALGGPATFSFKLPTGSTRTSISGVTAGGRALTLTKTYKSCAVKKPKKKKSPKPSKSSKGGAVVITEGSGVD